MSAIFAYWLFCLHSSPLQNFMNSFLGRAIRLSRSSFSLSLSICATTHPSFNLPLCFSYKYLAYAVLFFTRIILPLRSFLAIFSLIVISLYVPSLLCVISLGFSPMKFFGTCPTGKAFVGIKSCLYLFPSNFSWVNLYSFPSLPSMNLPKLSRISSLLFQDF